MSKQSRRDRERRREELRERIAELQSELDDSQEQLERLAMPNEFDEQAFFDAGFDAIGHAKIPGEPSPIEHWIQPEQKTSPELEAGAELDNSKANSNE